MSNGHRVRLVLGVIETDATFRREDVRGEPMWVGRCLFCQAKLAVPLGGDADPQVTVEHIVPRHHGGSDEPENLALACARCNGEKGRRTDNRAATDPRRLAVTHALLERRKERWPASARPPRWPRVDGPPTADARPEAAGESGSRATAEGEVALAVSRLFVYPVKSLAGVEVSTATLGERGFVGDRRFMLVDQGGRFLSQRKLPAMALLRATLPGDELRVEAAGVEPLRVAARPTTGAPRTVEVWGDRCQALEVDDGGWFEARLGRPCRLVYLPDDSPRFVDPDHARCGEQVGFADGFPYLLVGQASVDALGDELGGPVDVRRFRPNVVVTGAAPRAELGWTRLQLGAVTFASVKPCVRCVMVDVDPDTGARGTELLATLKRSWAPGGKPTFGQNLLAEGDGSVQVGDRVVVLGRAPG